MGVHNFAEHAVPYYSIIVYCNLTVLDPSFPVSLDLGLEVGFNWGGVGLDLLPLRVGFLNIHILALKNDDDCDGASLSFH